MNRSTLNSFGRGQALDRVMAQSSDKINVTKMNMEDFTNEKIENFVESVIQKNDNGPQEQECLPSRIFPPLTIVNKESEEACKADLKGQQANTEPSMSEKTSVMHKQHFTKVKRGDLNEFTFKEEDFPPL